jgi:peptidoglycan hydrolase-like protein with peptidoglycan-binding domain
MRKWDHLSDDIILKRGSVGEDVLRLQKALLAMGFNPIEVDGNFGDGTEAAVRALQESVGFKGEGVVDKNTWDFIMRTTWKDTEEPWTLYPNPKNPYQQHIISDVEAVEMPESVELDE